VKRRKLTQEQVDRANRVRDQRNTTIGTCVDPAPEESPRWVLVDGRPVLLPDGELERLR